MCVCVCVIERERGDYMFQLRHNSYCMLETGNRPVCSKSHCILSFHFYNNILIDRKNIVVEMSL